MTRYEIAQDKKPEKGFVEQWAGNFIPKIWKSASYEYIQIDLATAYPRHENADITLHLIEAMTWELLKKATQMGSEGWELESFHSDKKDLDKLFFRCIFKKAGALSRSPSLGPVEQHAGNFYNNTIWPDRIRDLWNPTPAIPASGLE
jgi:hypothetical protein